MQGVKAIADGKGKGSSTNSSSDNGVVRTSVVKNANGTMTEFGFDSSGNIVTSEPVDAKTYKKQ